MHSCNKYVKLKKKTLRAKYCNEILIMIMIQILNYFCDHIHVIHVWSSNRY